MDIPFDPAPYFNSAKFSDVLIRFADEEIKAHRIFLCTKSPYFQKALGPDSPFKESADGVLELHEDDAAALKEMLCYIYTSAYPRPGFSFLPSDSSTTTWEDHLNVMIVADKYGLPNLEKLAYEECAKALAKLEVSDDLVFRLVERSWEYADRERRFSKLIVGLPDVSGPRFSELFQHQKFRPWIDANPDTTRPLIQKHFRTLMTLPSFRTKISDDEGMALEHLDRLLQITRGCSRCVTH